MRYAVAFAAVSAAFLFQSPVAQAQTRSFPTAPWCSYTNTGMYNLTESCVYRTFEDCRDEVLGGNRGFCNVNPYIQAREPAPRPSRRAVQGR